jgi:diguanylate cyclase (GGDEF)-like protein
MGPAESGAGDIGQGARSTLTEKLARSFKLDLVHEGRSLGPVTLSLGVASFPDHGHSWEAVVAAADAALYSAKRAGRNRVVVGSSEVDRVSAVSR